ncbi:DNA-directed RNA polymerase III subunit 1-like [Gastrolobium bilobum]|uniref:DNA-directed RNA polymerase III subunit 1-like n=1 Tax=Gastrolobium bilobum TaxID=150636 RepID=UPI002AB2FBFC|nr:DNA-directed RNA polymerase III subunit 1-like [Gastrolobium bilobum]
MNRSRAEGVTFTKEPYIEDAGPRRVKNMQFSTLSESEVGKIGEVQVWRCNYYDSFKKPVHGGLLDPRMGPANKSLECATCHGSFLDCPGHYGYLNLALPVFNVGYLSTIVEILKCICKGCARILLNEDTCSVKKVASTLSIIHDCSKCNNDSVEELQSALSHIREARATNNLTARILDPFQVLSLFKRMLDKDCELLYVAERPEKLIITNIVVPPVAIRPSVIMDGSLRLSLEGEGSNRCTRNRGVGSIDIQEVQREERMHLLEVPYFKGNDLHGWLYRIGQYFEISQISEVEKVSVAVVCLDKGKLIGEGIGGPLKHAHKRRKEE